MGFLDFVNSVFKTSIYALFILFIMFFSTHSRLYLFRVLLNVYLMSINY